MSSVVACEIRVRDSAFATARDIHKLCLIAHADDETADAAERRLREWIDASGDSLNLEFVRVDAGDSETNWQALGIPSAPPIVPVTVLVGRNNGIAENFLIDHWEPAPSDEQLAAILDSPARAELADKLARHIAVLVYAPLDANELGLAADSDASTSTVQALQGIVESGIAGERIGLSMITVDRHDPAEQLLCRFMGLHPGSPETVCVAFGRGKLMSPPLTGEAIREENIRTLCDQIRQACSCSQPLQTMGVDLPLVWSDADDSNVVLMDAELDHSELQSEVQSMLAAKVSDEDASDPVMLAIPPGSPSAVSVSVTQLNPVSAARIAIGAAAVALVVLTFLYVRRQRGTE